MLIFDVLFVFATVFMAWVAVRVSSQVTGLVLSPVGMFIGIDLLSVWYALSPISPIERTGWGSLVVAASGTLAFSTVFLVVELLLRRSGTASKKVEPVSNPGASMTLWFLFSALVGMSILDTGIPSVFQIARGLLDPVEGADALTDVREVRRSSTKGHFFGEQYQAQGARRVVTEIGWRLVIVTAWVRAWLVDTRQNVLAARIISAGGLILIAGSGVRSSLVFIAVVVLVGRSIVRPVPLRRIFGAAAVVFLLAILVAPLSKGARGNETFVARAESMTVRVLSGNGANNAGIIRLVDSGELALGRGSVVAERAEAILPGVGSGGRPFANRLAQQLNPTANNTTYATPTQLGVFYADFKTFGVALGYAVSALIVGVSQRFLWTFVSLRDEFSVGFLASAIFLLAHSVITGPFGLMANLAVLVALWLAAVRVNSLMSAVRRTSVASA